MTKRAVVLFNLGGPDEPAAVQPFLFNLFHDPAILTLPQPMRFLLAKLISSKRAPTAREIYANLGGKSPLLDWTRKQADALEAVLNQIENRAMAGLSLEREQSEPACVSNSMSRDVAVYKVFIAMRYWHPMTRETVREVKAWGAGEIILLPLYPQFSTTTTGSSRKLWLKEAARQGLDVPTRSYCCWPTEHRFIAAFAASIRDHVEQLTFRDMPVRVLFSAHGLPEKVIRGGDPYQWQVEQTCEALVQAMGMNELDWVTCYQSRVGPLKWIGPSTEEEIRRAGEEEMAVVVVPVAFVSEHSETLVELDIEYRALAETHGVPAYLRVPTLCDNSDFIEGLAGLCRREPTKDPCGHAGGRICPMEWNKCPA